MERTHWDNYFLHQESGGLGLEKIVLKAHVQRFLLFRDTRDSILMSTLHQLGFPRIMNWM